MSSATDVSPNDSRLPRHGGLVHGLPRVTMGAVVHGRFGMRELRLVAVSDDGTRLILRPEGDDAPMALPVDERLHAAMRGDRARLGQLEIQMDSQVRPRDIQARIRSGESVESVAAAAAVPLDPPRTGPRRRTATAGPAGCARARSRWQ